MNGLGAFHHTLPPQQGDVVGCTDITRFFTSCNGQTTCSVKLTQKNHVAGCPGKAVVDYSCSGKPVRSSFWSEPEHNQMLTFGCDTPRPAEVLPSVSGVKPVRYVHRGQTFDIWPVGFTVPGHRYSGSISWKETDFASLIPGNPTTYKHTQQAGATGKTEPDTDYFYNYKHAYFCVTRKKKGWDCLRHYEILASGCIPYFVDLHRMPASTMAFFPKALVQEAMALPGVKYTDDRKGAFWFKEAFSIDWNVFNTTRYYEIAAKIQAHARRHLTSEAMAKYIMDAMGASGGPKNPKKVLYIHHCYHDFMGDSLWNGFKELEIKGVLDHVADVVPPRNLSTGGYNGYWGRLVNRGFCRNGRKVPLMTSDATLKRHEYYGWVNGWGNHRSHNYFPAETAVDADTIPDRIRNKEYDLIIYAAPSRTSAWLKEVSAHYPPSQVAFLSGADSPEDISTYARYSEKGRMFVRELYDDAGVHNNQRACFDAPGMADAQGLDCCAMEDGGAKIMWSTSYDDNSKWRPCGKENDNCTCSTEMRFGDPIKSMWSVFSLKGKEQVTRCNNANSGGPFPDPAVGAAKSCQCKV
eukprot:TRINITY_DN15674_c0_g1_i3.p1 TRINITY_DN15674_c0_g1~~TRINITY_DN15674_c0_g1_i3.p1  ORF type:complete len:579 (+),score=154.66 TRINITY_DN15674_c0_g1_i3:590-2326(+)